MRAPPGPADPSHDVSEVKSRLEVISEGPTRETTGAVSLKNGRRPEVVERERELDNCYQSSGDINSITQRESSRPETLTQTLI